MTIFYCDYCGEVVACEPDTPIAECTHCHEQVLQTAKDHIRALRGSRQAYKDAHAELVRQLDAAEARAEAGERVLAQARERLALADCFRVPLTPKEGRRIDRNLIPNNVTISYTDQVHGWIILSSYGHPYLTPAFQPDDDFDCEIFETADAAFAALDEWRGR
jgi:hypothetical protein